MKKIAFIFSIFLILALACTDKEIVSEDQLTDLSEYNMKIIPENPKSSDEIKLMVFDECTYNFLSGVTSNGNTIAIRKKFNSMMKWPCILQNDTILIGKLPKGNYSVNYKLIDTSTQVSDPVFLSVTFNLQVLK